LLPSPNGNVIDTFVPLMSTEPTHRHAVFLMILVTLMWSIAGVVTRPEPGDESSRYNSGASPLLPFRP
jgi:hypothetical protein